ncbi:MmgE/PrpD family protein [Actinomadura nitritigenes]|uniref:MmgE/PrpD family protein n=1 Tax=Actinomadura nitritigenes TaxID=134602 RepID=UPI003D925E42
MTDTGAAMAVSAAPGRDLTGRLAELIAAAAFTDLGPDALRMTRLSLLDGLGVMLAATGIEPNTVAFASLAAGDGTGSCTVLGHGLRSSAPLAAFANGAAAHALDFEDTHDRALVHPNAAAIPALLALAESEGGVTGERFLLSLAVGCDVTCRLGLALRADPMDRGWYPPPLLGALGATAAAAKLIGCDAAQICDALSMTLGQAAFSADIARDPRSVLRGVRDAFPAKTAVLSALLAREGVRGVGDPLAGAAGFFQLFAGGRYEPAALFEDWGERWAGASLSLKPWPSCRGTHGAIQAAVELAGTLDPADVAEIRVRAAPFLRMLVEPEEQRYEPATAIDAKFSIPYCTAVALSRGSVTLGDFAVLDDPEIRSLARMVRFEADGGLTDGRADLSVALRGGGSRSARVDRPYGGPLNPMSDDDVVRKFLDCAGRAAKPPAPAALRRVVNMTLALESVADVAADLMPDLS